MLPARRNWHKQVKAFPQRNHVPLPPDCRIRAVAVRCPRTASAAQAVWWTSSHVRLRTASRTPQSTSAAASSCSRILRSVLIWAVGHQQPCCGSDPEYRDVSRLSGAASQFAQRGNSNVTAAAASLDASGVPGDNRNICSTRAAHNEFHIGPCWQATGKLLERLARSRGILENQRGKCAS